MKLNELENMLLEHCYEMSILRRDANQKKKDSILDSLIMVCSDQNSTKYRVLIKL